MFPDLNSPFSLQGGGGWEICVLRGFFPLTHLTDIYSLLAYLAGCFLHGNSI